ncbi:hypothetical protein MRX96_059876 [Rhipicephalus microplus]
MDPDLDPREIAPVRLCEQLVSTRGTLRSPPPTFPWPELTTVYVKQAEKARVMELALCTQSNDEESAAVDFGGITVLILYLGPNLPIQDIKLFNGRDMCIYDKSKPFMLVGHINVDITNPNKHW